MPPTASPSPRWRRRPRSGESTPKTPVAFLGPRRLGTSDRHPYMWGRGPVGHPTWWVVRGCMHDALLCFGDGRGFSPRTAGAPLVAPGFAVASAAQAAYGSHAVWRRGRSQYAPGEGVI